MSEYDKTTIIDSFPEFKEDQAPVIVKYLCDGTLSLEDLHGNGLPFKVRKMAEQLYKDQKQQAQAHEDEAWFKAQQADSADMYESYLETYTYGSHRDEARAALKRLEEKESLRQQEDVWNSVDKTDIDDLKSFVSDNPESTHISEAKKLINELLSSGDWMEDLKVKLEKSFYPSSDIVAALGSKMNERTYKDRIRQLLDEIDKDKNWLAASTVKVLVDKDIIGYDDLRGCGIKEEFIEALRRKEYDKERTLEKASTKLENVSREDASGKKIALTEVYFWGIPSSGKTCALGSILEAAKNGNVATAFRPYSESQGFDYMNRLPMFFDRNKGVCVFPGSTDVASSYAMGFQLTDKNGAEHPVTFIDFAGELLAAMYKTYAKKELKDDEQASLETLTNVLVKNGTGNRKIHFFVVEYGAEDRKVKSVDLPQKEVLSTAMEYVDKAKSDKEGRNIFKTATDAVYLIVTKVDKLKLTPEEKKRGETKQAKLEKYVQDRYGTFYGSLKAICKHNQINGGNLPILGFSVGDVCFRDFFIPNSQKAESILHVIMERCHGNETGIWGSIKSLFRK